MIYVSELNYKNKYESARCVSVVDLSSFVDDIVVLPDDYQIRNKRLHASNCFIYEKNLSKKIVVLYGNCHMNVIKQMLLQDRLFSEKHYIYDLKPIYEIDDASYLNNPIFKFCDIFIHQSIRLDNRYGREFASSNIVKKLNTKCKIISVPNTYHLPMFLFPQFSGKKELHYKRQTYFFRDSIIDELLDKKGTYLDVLHSYQEGGIFSRESILEAYSQFIEKIKMREKEWDIKISFFIKDNLMNHLLFFDPNHPTNFYFEYIANELLKIIDERAFESKFDVPSLDYYQMPLCRDVIDALGLHYNTDIIRMTGVKMRYKTMDLPEYIFQYQQMRWSVSKKSTSLRVIEFCNFVFWKLLGKLFDTRDNHR